MSREDDIEPDGGGDDIFAAEYVLGMQSSNDRSLAALRMETEPALAALVDRWEVFFAPLASGYPVAEAPEGVGPRIEQRLFPDDLQDNADAVPPGPLGSVSFWRGLAVAALLLLGYLALPMLMPAADDAPKARLAASLATKDNAVRFIAVYDEQTEDIGLVHLSGQPREDREFELWVTAQGQSPVSLGAIALDEESIESGSLRLPVNEAQRPRFVPGALLSISEETVGGSDSGQPSGEMLAQGSLSAI